MTDATTDQPAPDSHFTRGISADALPATLAFPVGWASQADLPPFDAAPGVTMQSFVGGALMANWVTIEPDAAIPMHQHPHEQMGVMLRGSMELTIGEETRLLRPGDVYSVPPYVPHGGQTQDDGCLVLDVFTPVREDYAALARAAADRTHEDVR